MENFNSSTSTSDKAIVTGTSGTGKSLFRFYIIREWLLGNIDLECVKICINLFSSDTFFYINKEAEVTIAPANPQDYDAAALLDPCDLLKNKDLLFRLALATTSASPLAGQIKNVNFSEFRKNARIYVLPLWTVDEFAKLGIKVDPLKLEQFSLFIKDVQYCVPRLLLYTDTEIKGQLDESLKVDSRTALFRFLVSNKEECAKDPDLPYRLCVISYCPNTDDVWTACGFISEYIAEKATVWAAAGAKLQRDQFLNLLLNPFSKGLMGIWFENWAFGALTSGKQLQITNPTPGSPSIDATFSILDEFPGQQASAGTRRSVEISVGTLYQASSRNCPSIDGFGMVDGKLILAQMTVGRTHSAAQWKDIDYIVRTAQKVNPAVRIYLVYVIEKNQPFTVPECPTLPEGVSVVVGSVNDDFYPCCAKKISGEDVASSSIKETLVRRSRRLRGQQPTSSTSAAVSD